MPLKEFAEEPSAASVKPDRRFQLLYVEDEDVNWEVAVLHLGDRYTLHRACDSKEAFGLLARQTYHTILMDVQLGRSDLDGLEMTQILRGTYNKEMPEYAKGITAISTPIIFMTAYAARYKRDELVALGGDDLLFKPVNFVVLSSMISRSVLKAMQKK